MFLTEFTSPYSVKMKNKICNKSFYLLAKKTASDSVLVFNRKSQEIVSYSLWPWALSKAAKKKHIFQWQKQKRSERHKLRFEHITKHSVTTFGGKNTTYRVADKSLAWPGRTQTNVSGRMAWISFDALPCRGEKKELDGSSRLDVVEIAPVPDMLPSLFPSWSG